MILTAAALRSAWPSRVTLILATALLAACSATPAAPGAAGTIVPGGGGAATQQPGGGGAAGVTGAKICELVPGTAVTAIVGKPLAEAKPDAKGCGYSFNKKDSQIPGLGGTVDLRAEGTDTELRGAKTAFPGGEDISGLGDRAYWADGLSVLYFVKGGVEFACQLILFDKAEPRKDMAVKVAQLLLSKL